MNEMRSSSTAGAQDSAAVAPSFGELVSAAGRVGVLSFGGPAGQIALMHKVFVEEKRWLGEQQFLSALNFCMLLPGPEAMQLATYVGWRLHGIAGGLAAGLLFVIPGAIVVLALSAIYAAFGSVPLVTAIFVGIKAAVLAIVIEALLRVAKRALKLTSDWWIAGAAFVAIFALHVPFPLIILTAAFIGFFRTGRVMGAGEAVPQLVAWQSTARTIAIWLAVWLVPLALLFLTLGSDHVLSLVGWFFSKLAVVTFGGAYAVLAYMAQQAVENYGWLTAGEMLDGLGLAETTPGPLILVTEYVGFLAGWRDGGWAMAVAAAGVTLWMTFAPCFLWIFAGAPYVEWLNGQPRLKGALSAVTAAVVGVILNLSVWFALKVLFAASETFELGPVRFDMPLIQSVDVVAMGLALIAVVLLFGLHRGVMTVLGVCALGGLAASWIAS